MEGEGPGRVRKDERKRAEVIERNGDGGNSPLHEMQFTAVYFPYIDLYLKICFHF